MPTASARKTAAKNEVRYERNDLQPLCSEPPASGANGGSKRVRGTSTFATYVEGFFLQQIKQKHLYINFCCKKNPYYTRLH